MEAKGKLIHCNGIPSCEELKDFGYIQEHWDEDHFRNIFLKDYNLDYILNITRNLGIHFHIATHAIATSTCEEKSKITGLSLERVIKGVYYEDSLTEFVYALVIPGLKKKIDLRLKIAEYLGIDPDEVLNNNRITKARSGFLPMGIKFGTVHPWINYRAFSPGGKLRYIFFDKQSLEKRSLEEGTDDFSFTVNPINGYDNHKLSLQMNYSGAHDVLEEEFPNRIHSIDLI